MPIRSKQLGWLDWTIGLHWTALIMPRSPHIPASQEVSHQEERVTIYLLSALDSVPGARFTKGFYPQFKYDGNFALPWLRCWPSDRNKFCTCHDSTAVVPCTKFCSDHGIRVEVRVKRNFHRIWIAMEKPLVKRGPGHGCAAVQSLPDTIELVYGFEVVPVSYKHQVRFTFTRKGCRLIRYFEIELGLLLIGEFRWMYFQYAVAKHSWYITIWPEIPTPLSYKHLTSWSLYKMVTILHDDSLKRIFLNENAHILIRLFLKFIFACAIKQVNSIVSDNGLTLNRRQVIIWNIAGLVYCRV